MIFKRLVYIIMTVLVLLADSGQTIYAHTCLRTNRTKLAFTNASCCHKAAVKDGKRSFRKPSCCRINATVARQIMPSNVNPSNQIDVAAAPVFVAEIFKVSSPLSSMVATDAIGFVPESPGKADILFTRVFRC